MLKNKLLLLSLLLFIGFATRIDRACAKASHRFCLQFIDGPRTSNTAWGASTPFPAPLLDQPFFYLGKGAQSFVFESADQEWVIKFYKFPAHLRRFDWIKHPFGDLFSKKNQEINAHNERRFLRSFNSYLLAHQELAEETGVTYIHLNPTPHLQKNLLVFDRAGTPHHIPLARIGFIVQKKGEPFFPRLSTLLQNGRQEEAKQMINSLFQLILARCKKGISDLDNMDHNNYGWYQTHALHLDVGRFVRQDKIDVEQELRRVTGPLATFLEENSPELLLYYNDLIQLIIFQ
jgi:hypothetical protein